MEDEFIYIIGGIRNANGEGISELKDKAAILKLLTKLCNESGFEFIGKVAAEHELVLDLDSNGPVE